MPAIGGSTITASEKALKLVYKNGVQGCDYENSKALAMMQKSTTFEGKTFEVVLKYSKPQGGGPVFESAQGDISGVEYDKFSVPRKKYYWFARIDNETMDAAAGDVGSVVALSKEEISGARDEFIRFMGILAWGDGSGALTKITALATGNTVLTLTNPTDVYFFQPNMYICLTTNKTTVVGGGQAVRITGIDEDAGTITVASDITTAIPGAATTQWIHRRNDVQKAPMGVGGYVVGKSGGAPGTLYGLNRDTYPSRMAGYSFNGSTKGFTKALVDGFQVQRAGSTPGDTIFMSSKDLGTFLIQCEANKWRTDRAEISTKQAGVSYEGITVYTPGGTKKIIDDPNLKPGDVYSLNLKNFCWKTNGAFPKLITEGGKVWIKLHTADLWEAQLGMYGNMTLDNPGNQAYYYNMGTG